MSKLISPKVTRTLYCSFVLCYLVCHIDLGIIAVSATDIQDYLGITEGDLGLIECALYIGNVLGSLVCALAYRKFQAKHVLIFAAVMNGLLLMVFTFTKIYWLIFFSRVGVGIFQVIFTYT